MAAVRRASDASGVTRAAVFFGVSSVSRSSRAAARASSLSSSASTRERPCNASVTSSRDEAGAARASRRRFQSLVSEAGARASLIRRRRARSGATSASTGQGRISDGLRPSQASVAPNVCCGWLAAAAIDAQLFAVRSGSSPGNTISPRGSVRTACIRRRVAAPAPVEPAMTTGCCGGFFAQRVASASAAPRRRTCGSE